MEDNDDDGPEKLQMELVVVPTRLSNLDVSSLRSFREKECVLGSDYEVRLQDVICGTRGGRDSVSHPGNERFRVHVAMRVERYRQATSRVEKTRIVKEIVAAIRESDGNFIKHEEGNWVDIGDVKAREKVGAALRAAANKSAKSAGGHDRFTGEMGRRILSRGAGKSTAVVSEDSNSSEAASNRTEVALQPNLFVSGTSSAHRQRERRDWSGTEWLGRDKEKETGEREDDDREDERKPPAR